MSAQLLVAIIVIGFILLLVLSLELRDLRREKDLRIDEYVDTNTQNYTSNNTADNSDVGFTLDAIYRYYRASSAKQERYYFLQRIIGLGTIAVVAAYTAITFSQLEALISVQRAFINVSELRHEAIPDMQGRIRLTPIIKNSGTTAARNVTVIVVNPNYAAIIRDRTTPPNMANIFDWKMGAPQDPEALLDRNDISDVLFKFPNLSIGPGGTLTASEISSDVVANIGWAASSNQTGRFLYGLVRFDDIFNNRHISKFCFRLDDFVGGRSEFRYGICRHWNCTDDDCKEDSKAYSAEAPSVLAELKRRMEEMRPPWPSPAAPPTRPDMPPKP